MKKIKREEKKKKLSLIERRLEKIERQLFGNSEHAHDGRVFHDVPEWGSFSQNLNRIANEMRYQGSQSSTTALLDRLAGELRTLARYLEPNKEPLKFVNVDIIEIDNTGHYSPGHVCVGDSSGGGFKPGDKVQVTVEPYVC